MAASPPVAVLQTSDLNDLYRRAINRNKPS